MSEPRPGEDPGVYTLPEAAFRVSEGAAPAAPSTPPQATAGAARERPRSEAPRAGRPAPEDAASVPERRRRGWDVVLTILLLLLGAAAAVLGSFLALFIVLLADGCGSVNCDYQRLNLGLWVALTAPWAAWAVALVISIVLLVRRRLAFWMPLAGIVLIVAAWFFGAWVASTGVG